MMAHFFNRPDIQEWDWCSRPNSQKERVPHFTGWKGIFLFSPIPNRRHKDSIEDEAASTERLSRVEWDLNKLITEGRAAVLPLWSSWDWHVHPCSSAHQKEVTAALSWWLGVERAWIRHWQLLSFHTWDARLKWSSLSFFGRRFVPWWTWFHCTILKEFFISTLDVVFFFEQALLRY